MGREGEGKRYRDIGETTTDEEKGDRGRVGGKKEREGLRTYLAASTMFFLLRRSLGSAMLLLL